MTLDERRIDARKVCNSACVKPKSADWKPSSSIMARDPGKLFFRNVVARILSNIVVKVSFKLIWYTKDGTYFVTKTVLTYCEKKNVLVMEKNF